MNAINRETRMTVINESRRSAQAIIPYILEKFKPGSIVDFGCAEGTWLSIAKSKGVSEVYGYDDDWVMENPDLLLLDPVNEFHTLDLEKIEAGKFLKDRYVMAFCLEVAEHLTDGACDRLIETLCQLAGVTIFSAAIPGQGGYGHINEQWQDHWIRKFAKHKMYPDMWLRSRIWNDARIQPYYKQNIMTFTYKCRPDPNPVNVVHPDLWMYKMRALGAIK